jgi:hypothetical protein
MFFMINPTKINHKLKMKNISVQGRHKRNSSNDAQTFRITLLSLDFWLSNIKTLSL